MDLRLRSARFIFLLVLGIILVGSQGIFSQDVDEDQPENVPCEPASFKTVYDKFQSDSVKQSQIAIWYSLGQEEYKYKNYKRAIPYFWKIALNDKTGRFRVVFSKLADSYFHLDHIDSTLLIVYLGLKKHPKQSKLHFWAGFVQDQLGHVKCAIPHYEALVKAYPKNLEYWKKLAYLYFKAEDSKAIEAQKTVVSLDPKNVDATRLLAEIMNHFGEDPITALADAFKKDPKNVEIAFRYGKSAFDAGMYNEALKPFEAVLASNPNHIEAIEYLGKTHESLDQLTAAIKDYKRILKINPRDAKVMCLIASAYGRMNNFRKALIYVNKAKRINPRFGLAYMTMAEIYENAVNYCSNKRNKSQLTYDDKIVYNLAAREYRKAARDPNFAAKANSRRRQLQSLLPSKEDLFMHKNSLKPKAPCYSWIR